MKSASRSIFDFLSYSNIFVGLCAFVFSRQAIFIYGAGFPGTIIQLYPLLFSLSVFFVYGLQRVAILLGMMRSPQAPDSLSQRDVWMIRHMRTLTGLLFLSAAGIIFLVFYIDWKSILYFLPLLLISVFYFAGPFPLKKIPGIKSFFISFVWAAGAYIVPGLLGNKTFGFHFWMYVTGQFFLLAALCVPFDVRDFETDKIKNVKSLPVLLGVSRSKVLAAVMLLVYVFLAGGEASYETGTQKVFFCVSLFTACYALLIVLSANPKRSSHFFSFLADGGLIVQGLGWIIFYSLYGAFYMFG